MTSKPSWLQDAQDSWTFRGQNRPPFAIEPGPNQESVWDYPRPPAIVPDRRTVVVKVGDVVIAQSTDTVRVCETASPPAFYIPPNDINFDYISVVAGSSFCEWKGPARYWAVSAAALPPNSPPATISVGWDYPDPLGDFRSLAGYLSFYPGRVDCFVDDERVQAQAGGFYGGWITQEIVGPFKGDPGTGGW